MMTTYFISLLLFLACLTGGVSGQGGIHEKRCSLPGPCPPLEQRFCTTDFIPVVCSDPKNPTTEITVHANCCTACNDGYQQPNCKEA